MGEMRRIFTNQPEPVIYFRFHKGALMYIGETQDLKQGRPFRDGDKDAHKESHIRFRKIVHKKRLRTTDFEKIEKMENKLYDRYIGEYDKVITMKASKNPRRRKYWEAYFIVKYKPATMSGIDKYVKLLKGRNYKLSGQEKEKMLNGRKVHLNAFSKANQESIIKKLEFQQLTGMQMYVDASESLLREKEHPR